MLPARATACNAALTAHSDALALNVAYGGIQAFQPEPRCNTEQAFSLQRSLLNGLRGWRGCHLRAQAAVT